MLIFFTSKLKVPSVNSSNGSRKDMTFIRIGGTYLIFIIRHIYNTHSYDIPPIIKICRLSRIFLQSIIIDMYPNFHLH